MTTRLNVVQAEDLRTQEAIDEALQTADDLIDVGLAQVALVQGLLQENDGFHVQVGSETIVDDYVGTEVLNSARLQVLDGLLQLREVRAAISAKADRKGKLQAA